MIDPSAELTLVVKFDSAVEVALMSFSASDKSDCSVITELLSVDISPSAAVVRVVNPLIALELLEMSPCAVKSPDCSEVISDD